MGEEDRYIQAVRRAKEQYDENILQKGKDLYNKLPTGVRRTVDAAGNIVVGTGDFFTGGAITKGIDTIKGATGTDTGTQLQDLTTQTQQQAEKEHQVDLAQQQATQDVGAQQDDVDGAQQQWINYLDQRVKELETLIGQTSKDVPGTGTTRPIPGNPDLPYSPTPTT